MQMESTKSGILADKGLRDILTSNGELLQAGDICYNKKLAETLRKISIYGTEPFYNGSIGSDLVRDIRRAGGIMTLNDLKKYEVKMREPISANILGLEVHSMPPPSSGGASMVLLIPNVVMYENWTTVIGDHFEVPSTTRRDLQKKGHVLKGLAGGTICQFVVHNFETGKGSGSSGELVAVSDPRKGRYPAGF